MTMALRRHDLTDTVSKYSKSVSQIRTGRWMFKTKDNQRQYQVKISYKYVNKTRSQFTKICLKCCKLQRSTACSSLDHISSS